MTFLTTGTFGNVLIVWNVRAIPRRQILYAGIGVMSRPLNKILPELGLSEAEIRLKSVVLPAPFGPMSPMISPCSTWKLDVRHRSQSTEITRDVLTFKQVHVDLL